MGELESGWLQLASFFADELVDEILINGEHSATVVVGVRSYACDSPFRSNGNMLTWLMSFARHEGVRLDPVCGSAGGRISMELCQRVGLGQSHVRWHALLPPLSQDGPLMTVRRHRFGHLTWDDFGGTPASKEKVLEAARNRRSLLIAGPTGSGKTTLLMTLLAEVAPQERVVILESLAELPKLFPSWIRLLERPPNLEGIGATSIERLMREALRLRPDRMVLGEIRGKEARSFLGAILSGHSGGMATIHAGSVAEARSRFMELSNIGYRSGKSTALGGYNASLAALDVVLLARGAPPQIMAYDAFSG
jgi:Flp pilus assembly CpaF family ATPase